MSELQLAGAFGLLAIVWVLNLWADNKKRVGRLG